MTTYKELAELNLNTRVEHALIRDYCNKHSDMSCAEYLNLLYENDNALRGIRNLGEKGTMEFRMKYHNKHYSTGNAYDIIRETFPLILMKNSNGKCLFSLGGEFREVTEEQYKILEKEL